MSNMIRTLIVWAAVCPTIAFAFGLEDPPAELDAKARSALEIAREWKENPDHPHRSADGSVKYLYGATLPTLVCMPLQVCTIRLQPGETVNDAHAGDTARWKIKPAIKGTGSKAVTYIVVKPTRPNLTTSLFITTNRRAYTIKLVSSKTNWMPVLSFDYPEDMERAWASYQAAQARHTTATVLPTGQNLSNLDFNFRIHGDRPAWRPQRVYTDEVKTYIQFSRAGFYGSEAPALIALADDGGLFSKPTEQLVNYRLVGDRYEVDTVLTKAALISGVGRQQIRVLIERTRSGGENTNTSWSH